MENMEKFQKINNNILNIITNLDIEYEAMTDKSYKLPLSDALFCISDIRRNKIFFDSIQLAIKSKKNQKEIIVVDAGSGTWILWFFAIYLWASKCVFIEHNPYTIEVSKSTSKKLGIYDKCEFILADASKINLEENYDILISETIIASMIEDFHIIMKNLIKYTNKNAIIIPHKLDIFIDELDINKNTIYEHILYYDMGNWFSSHKIKIHKLETNSVLFGARIYLYGNITIKNKDCPLFLNNIEFDFKKEKHPIFEFEY